MKDIDQWKIDGAVVLIDKPYGWTSFDVVKKLRNVLKYKKIGHAGTLDPLATGLLILCFGRFTKRIEEIQSQTKEYIAEIKLGASTPSFDLETEVDANYPTEHITPELLQSTLKQFEGEISQYPPKFSAVKIDGKRAYEYARSGEEVELKSRDVHIYKFEILSYENNIVKALIQCSKGTYIRSLARDLGVALDSGAHLHSLRRTKIGNFSVEEAKDPSFYKTEEDFNLHSLKEIEGTS